MKAFRGRGARPLAAAGGVRSVPPGWWVVALLALLALTGCRGPARPSPQTAAPFVPPTATPSPTPAAMPTPTAPTTPLTPTPCINALTFVADETIPDGEQVPPGAALLKVWRVRNTGTCPWGPDYTLRFIAGEPMAADETQPLFPAAPGEEVRLEVRFQAPATPGLYQSTWQAFDPHDQAFGDPIFIIIEVVAEPSATATP